MFKPADSFLALFASELKVVFYIQLQLQLHNHNLSVDV
jgi:hypothetical protein